MYLAVYEGKDRRVNHDSIDDLDTFGWNMYMTPHQALYGIEFHLKNTQKMKLLLMLLILKNIKT